MSDPDVTQYHLVTDSLNYAVGAALHQIISGDPVPIGTLLLTENFLQHTRRSCTLSHKLKAEMSPCIQTTITFPSFQQKTPMKSDKQQIYLSIITEYITDVLYIKGDKNVVADCLSQPTCSVTIDPCDLPVTSESQKEDEKIDTYRSQLKLYEM